MRAPLPLGKIAAAQGLRAVLFMISIIGFETRLRQAWAALFFAPPRTFHAFTEESRAALALSMQHAHILSVRFAGNPSYDKKNRYKTAINAQFCLSSVLSCAIMNANTARAAKLPGAPNFARHINPVQHHSRLPCRGLNSPVGCSEVILAQPNDPKSTCKKQERIVYGANHISLRVTEGGSRNRVRTNPFIS